MGFNGSFVFIFRSSVFVLVVRECQRTDKDMSLAKFLTLEAATRPLVVLL